MPLTLYTVWVVVVCGVGMTHVTADNWFYKSTLSQKVTFYLWLGGKVHHETKMARCVAFDLRKLRTAILEA